MPMMTDPGTLLGLLPGGGGGFKEVALDVAEVDAAPPVDDEMDGWESASSEAEGDREGDRDGEREGDPLVASDGDDDEKEEDEEDAERDATTSERYATSGS